jgi:4-amino-4-deoxy-L-arabinose transferase-like glycosyltransferase
MIIPFAKPGTSSPAQATPSRPRSFFEKSAALIIAVCFCGIIFFSLDDYGVTWDEGVYFHAGRSYFRWLKEPSLGNIDSYWAINHEHPPALKLLAGLTHYLFHEKLKIFNNISSYRLPILVFVFFSIYFIFLFASELFGLKIALITGACFFFLPRVFFYSHLGVMDYAVTSLWLMVIYAYWKGMENPKWIFVSAILLGFALLTKINAWLIYIPLLFYWILRHSGHWKATFQGKARLVSRDGILLFSKLVPLIVIPPIIFVVLWPWLWKETLERIFLYLAFHRHHPFVYVYYLGTQTPLAPWHYPWVLTLITVPLVTLIPFIIGWIRIIVCPNRTNVFLLFNALFPLLLISLPSVPKYDGERLFLPAFPFICLIAGMGIQQISLWAKKFQGEKIFYLLYACLLIWTLYSSVIKIHPYQSSYFNEVIGGVDGAVQKGFEPEYWGNAYIGVLELMNKHPENKYWIYMADVEPKILWGWKLYKEDELLGKSIQFGDKNNSDYLILLIRPGFFDEEMWHHYKYKDPVFSVKLSNTPLVNVYDLKEFRAKR